MDRLGVPPGGFIRVSTRRGEVVLKARADRDVAEGMVFIPFCFAEAAANLLTNPQLDPMGKIPEFKFCAAKVERGRRWWWRRSEAGPRISYAVRGSASLRFCAAKVEPAMMEAAE